MDAGVLPRGLHLGADPQSDLLQPVRHRVRPGNRQRFLHLADVASPSDEFAHLRDRSEAAVLGQQGGMDVLGLRYRAPECPPAWAQPDIQDRRRSRHKGRRDRRGGAAHRRMEAVGQSGPPAYALHRL